MSVVAEKTRYLNGRMNVFRRKAQRVCFPGLLWRQAQPPLRRRRRRSRLHAGSWLLCAGNVAGQAEVAQWFFQNGLLIGCMGIVAFDARSFALRKERVPAFRAVDPGFKIRMASVAKRI
jgi:hypothetical protein